MATVKRGDILHKNTSRGRPPKPDKERKQKQRQAYQWRDARRVYLAGSFERWRKLRGRLQLKDSSLAWHLLETHDKGCDRCSPSGVNATVAMGPDDDSGSASVVEQEKDASQFYPGLIAALRRLCHAHLTFSECVEVMGLICVEIDHMRKDNYSLKEVVCNGSRPKGRVHERDQAQHEAIEAEAVSAALSCGGRGLERGGTQNVGSLDITPEVNSKTDCDISVDVENRLGGDKEVNNEGLSLNNSYVADGFLHTAHENREGISLSSVPSDSTRNYPSVPHTLEDMMEQGKDASNNGYQVLSRTEAKSDNRTSVMADHLSNTDKNRDFTQEDMGNFAVRPSVVQVTGSTEVRSAANTVLSRTSAWSDTNVCSEESVSGDNVAMHEIPVSHSAIQNSPYASEENVTSREVRSSGSDQVYRVDLTVYDQESPQDSLSMMNETSSSETALMNGVKSDPEINAVIAVPKGAATRESRVNFANTSGCAARPTVIKKEPGGLDLPVDTSNAGAMTSFHDNRALDEVDVPLDMSVVKDEDPLRGSNSHMTLSHPPGETSSRVGGHVSLQNNAALSENGGLYSALDGSPDSESASTIPVSSTRLAADSSAGTPSSPGSRTCSTPITGETVSSPTSSMAVLQQYADHIFHSQMASSHMSSHLDSTGDRKRRHSDGDGVGDGEGGPPWVRRDMTQKTEYQYLETDPFMDFGEMSRSFPNMQQRTFYRWKRRIKDQFIFLEQRPTWTYSQFSACFPQVREQVFHHWRSMMARGHRFLADTTKTPVLANLFGSSQFPADSGAYKDNGSEGHQDTESEDRDDKEDGAKDEEEERDETTAQYIFLQKNLGLEAEQFAQIFPGVSRQTFYAWKKQILIDFLRLQSNPQVTYQEFRKHASVTQDVFTLWKSQVALAGSHNPVTTTCTPLSTLPHSSTAPSLPPLSLLAANANSEHLMASAELATWYRSYAPLMGQMALPLWSPLRLMSGHALTSSSSSAHTGLNTERDQHDERDNKPVRSTESGRGEVGERDQTKENDMNTSLHQPVMVATDGIGNHCGRRVSMKPEQYYFLQNPDISHSALCRLFPGVSAQRYARWRRKVASSLALLQREPHCTDEQFALYFPNVPSEILASWRRRVEQGLALAPLGTQDIGPEPALPSSRMITPISPVSNTPVQQSHDLSVSSDRGTEETPNFLLERSRSDGGDGLKHQDTSIERIEPSHLSPTQGSSRKRHKPSREEFLFVQRCPQVDFTTFSSYYPGISVRTFYRWRRQVRDGMNLLRSEPSITLQNFQQLFPDVSEEVFYTWKASIQEENAAVSATSHSGALENCASQMLDSSRDTLTDDMLSQPSHATDVLPSRVPDVEMALVTDDTEDQKQKCRPEQLLVHLHPYMDYGEFSRTYPGVSHRTFYRWKQEARQVMEYMRDHSDVQYEDIAAVLPDVTFEAFRKWQSLIAESGASVSASEKEDEGHSPLVQSGRLMQHCSTKHSEPATSVGEHARGAESVAVGSQQVCELAAGEEEDMGGSKGRRHVREEFIQVMLNPSMDYAQFAQQFGTVSQRTFYRWRRHIREWRAFIRENPNVDFASFSQTARDVPESVFRIWQALEHGPQQPEKTMADLMTGNSVFDNGHTRVLDNGQSVITNDMISCVDPADSPLNLMDSNLRGDNNFGEDEGHKEAHQHFLHHPKLEYEELVAVYPQVAPATFQRWKKSVGMKLEYIRSIRSTNYPDFHSLFPDVPEDVFNVWKALVLKEPRHADNFLFLGRDDTQASLTHPTHPSSSALGMSVLPSHSAGLLSHDSQSDSESGIPVSSGHHVSFGGSSLPSAESLQQRTSPALPSTTGRDGEKVKGGVSVRVKTESPTAPLPSFTETVSNLTRLSAMLHHHLPPGLPEPAPLPAPPTSLTCHTATASSGNTGSQGTFSTVLADIVSGSMPADVTDDREEEMPRLSQRQRKVHRVEYIFVQQNPDVDVQEFTKRFPGVSPRSFYRWKREIREEQDGQT